MKVKKKLVIFLFGIVLFAYPKKKISKDLINLFSTKDGFLK